MFVYVVFNINGDVIGVADSHSSAVDIYEQRYGYIPDDIDDKIRKFKMNKLEYA